MAEARQVVKRIRLKDVTEYRDLLRNELATVEGHLAVAKQLSDSDKHEALNCWLSSYIQAPERLN